MVPLGAVLHNPLGSIGGRQPANTTMRPHMVAPRGWTNFCLAMATITGRACCLMAQVNKVFSVRTLALVAHDLAADEDWLAESANGLNPEDGLIWVNGIDDEDGVMAFNDIGVENLATLISDYGSIQPREHDESLTPRPSPDGYNHRGMPDGLQHRASAQQPWWDGTHQVYEPPSPGVHGYRC